MQSAFGVDHGDISKGRFVWPKAKRPPTRAQKRTQGAPGAKSGPQQVKAAANKITETPVSIGGIGRATGSGMRGVGGFLEKRPGLTGTALVGGGGAAGYHQYKKGQKR